MMLSPLLFNIVPEVLPEGLRKRNITSCMRMRKEAKPSLFADDITLDVKISKNEEKTTTRANKSAKCRVQNQPKKISCVSIHQQ